MKKFFDRFLASALSVAMAVGLAACGAPEVTTSGTAATSGGAAVSASTAAAAAATSAGTAATSAAAAASTSAASASTGEKIVNIGVTSQLSTINPLNIDVTFFALYAQSLMFLPLVSFDKDAKVEGMLADSVTSDDNKTFTIKLKDVNWSDGQPVTADDVIWTMLKISSAAVANTSFNFSGFEGFNDDGTSPAGATSVAGIKKVDDKTVQFIAKNTMSLQSFINNICIWVCVLPSHVLKDVPDDQLTSYDWFNKPDVVDGPYFLDSYDAAHFISYHANKDYYLGAPKVDKLNFKVVQGAELLAGLQSGEIDFVQPSIGIVPNTDLESIQALSNVKVEFTSPVTNQMTFINTRKIKDARVRQAILYAIDRQSLVDNLLGGHGEVDEGFVSSASPYYDDSVTKVSYDPEKAKALLKEAGWDSSTKLNYYVWSGDDAMVKGINMVKQNLGDVGININIKTVDLDSLMAVAGKDDADIFTVQYTITPNDFYIDAQYLVDTADDSWTGGYTNDTLHKAIEDTQVTTDDAQIKADYKTMDEQLVKDVPMFSMYFISNAGVVSNRLQNAEPTLYGAFNHVEQWDVTD
ncbi:MAG: ABC transporter substrate-binding protein [Lachnospiraceae bacterium]|jgi:peptide/nickel transport system substrate-binding protein|nr:ABC transporter substrate-binding protein [Lachnospiraceae bacterium]